MATLILAGETIVAVSDVVTATRDGWTTPDAIYPRTAGVTGIVSVDSLPEDFAPERFMWRSGQLVRREMPPPPEPVPQRITALQARRALLAADMLDSVEAAIARQPREVQIAWEYATELHRDDPMLAAVAQTIGLDAVTLDDLFRAAGKL
jgi:hypothetical protein